MPTCALSSGRRGRHPTHQIDYHWGRRRTACGSCFRWRKERTAKEDAKSPAEKKDEHSNRNSRSRQEPPIVTDHLALASSCSCFPAFTHCPHSHLTLVAFLPTVQRAQWLPWARWSSALTAATSCPCRPARTATCLSAGAAVLKTKASGGSCLFAESRRRNS